MARKQIAPAIMGYENYVLDLIKEKMAINKGLNINLSCEPQQELISRISNLSVKFNQYLLLLEDNLKKYNNNWSNLRKAKFCKNQLLKNMQSLRKYADELELILSEKYNPFPTYEDILYSVKY